MIDLAPIEAYLDRLDRDNGTQPGEYVPVIARLLVELVELTRGLSGAPVDHGPDLVTLPEPTAGPDD